MSRTRSPSLPFAMYKCLYVCECGRVFFYTCVSGLSVDDLCLDLKGQRDAPKTSLKVNKAVATNNNHSRPPKTVAAIIAPQPFSSVGHALLPMLTATAMKPESQDRSATASTVTRVYLIRKWSANQEPATRRKMTPTMVHPAQNSRKPHASGTPTWRTKSPNQKSSLVV